MQTYFFREEHGGLRRRWRNLSMPECKSYPPRVDELEWVEVPFAFYYPD